MTKRSWFERYFGSVKAATPEEVGSSLWNTEVGPDQYSAQGEKYQHAVLEQYKLYVEMTDRISSRRALANTFFLTLNAAVFTLIGVFWKDRPDTSRAVLVVPFVVLLALCLAWFWMVRAYRQLNSGKFAVIGALERRLPASPYWSAEWKALGEGDDKARYWPLTHVEKWVPVLFAVAYTAGFIGAIVL